MHPDDAARYGVADGDEVAVAVRGGRAIWCSAT